jgi:hypothetical protein
MSYFAPLDPPTLPPPGGLRSSWLRISRTVPPGPGNAAMPSSASGVGLPSDIVEPISPNVTYENPAGRARMRRPSWSGVAWTGP